MRPGGYPFLSWSTPTSHVVLQGIIISALGKEVYGVIGGSSSEAFGPDLRTSITLTLFLTRFLIDVQVIVAELFKEITHDINAVLDITWRWA